MLLGDTPQIEISGPATVTRLAHAAGITFTPVFFDLETSGLGGSAEIVQLAATTPSRCSTFMEYVLPCGSISKSASDVTGISIGSKNGGRVLLKDGKVLPSKPLADTIRSFVEWLEGTGHQNIVLVAHNCFAFDLRVLLAQVLNLGDDATHQLLSAISGFADTLPALKEARPGRQSYTQEDLVSEFVGEAYDAHSADGDVGSLEKLFHKTLDMTQLLCHSMDAQSALALHKFREVARQSSSELRASIPKSALSDCMASKIAKSGLRHRDLQLAFERNGQAGLSSLLGEKDDAGTVRVTKSHSVIKKISDHFQHSGGKPGPQPSAKELPVLSEQTLALYQKRRENGYDLPDPHYRKWLESVSTTNSPK